MAPEQESNHDSLAEPLLSPAEQAAAASTAQTQNEQTVKRDVPTTSEDGADASGDGGTATTMEPFSVKTEIFEMLHLALPLAVSFFCRMGMASTDR
jgi:hypothetical protein